MNSRFFTLAMTTLSICALLVTGCTWRGNKDEPNPARMTTAEFVLYLEGVTGVQQARATSDYIEFSVSTDMDHAVLDQAMRDIETTYHNTDITSFPRDLRITYGPFVSEVRFTDPQASSGIPRESLPYLEIAHQLVDKKGITGGTIRSRSTTVQVDTGPSEWIETNAANIDREFSVTSGSKDTKDLLKVRINPTDSQHVKLLKDTTDAVKKRGGTLTEFTVEPCYNPAGCTERNWTIHATTHNDDQAVDLTKTLIDDFENHTIAVTGSALTLNDMRSVLKSSTPKADPQLVLDTLTDLISAGIRVEQVSVNRNSFTVRVDTSRELNSALKVFASAQPASPGTAVDKRLLPNLSVAHGTQSEPSRLTLSEWNQRAPMVTAAWETGFTDFMVRESRNRNSDFEITLTKPGSGSAFDPGYLRAAARAFRAEPWDGTASVVLYAGNHPSFTSTSCGQAQNVRNRLAGAPERVSGQEQAFVDAWNATATC